MPISPELIMPILLFALVWCMAVIELRRGLRKGEMREYLRRDYAECGHDRPEKYCRRDGEPKTFWALFLFYLVFAIAIPIAVTYAVLQRAEEPSSYPTPSQAEEAPRV